MNEKQLKRCIQSIGKACFVQYFQEFSDPNLSREDLIEMLMAKEGYEETGSTTRVTQSRRIISAGRADDALEIIANSVKVPYPFRKKARDLRGCT